MAMSDFVVREAIVPALAATGREAVIRELVQSLRAAGHFTQDNEVEEAVRAVMRREQLGSTGIGKGIAIPHAKNPTADKLLGTVALSRTGVAWESIDGEPVFVIVLLVSPQDRPGDHLRALENAVRTLRDDAFVRALRQCTTADEIWALLTHEGPNANWGR